MTIYNYTVNPPAYTKLDSTGKELDACATEWAMVKDNVTGLVWEVKTDDGSIHDKDDKYVLDKSQDSDLDAQTDFIYRLNSEEFGGKSDWRLPTIKELFSIANKGNYNPAINISYFPNTISTAYWSSTTYTANGADDAWYVTFDSGYSYHYDRSNSWYVRAVSGGNVTNNLVDNGDGTVSDTTTGLMWQQIGTTSADGNVLSTWEEAMKFCETLQLAGYDDWRLPNIHELQSIVKYEKKDLLFIDTSFFLNTERFHYWASTTYINFANAAWNINFNDGLVDCTINKSESLYVRAVRNY